MNVEPFIRSEFLNQMNTTALRRITLVANYLQQDLYFQYPSEFNPNFLSLNASSFDNFYNKTMANYYQSNETYEYSIFSENHSGN